MKTVIALTLCLLLMFSAQASSGAKSSIHVGSFTNTETSLWQEEAFEGHTDYTFIPEGNALVLKAHCDGTASALYRRIKIDLTKTPVLRWSWKIDNIHAGLDDVSKAGDDYAARVYVVYKGKLPWDVKALDYVWANTQPAGHAWPNAFSSRAIMIAQRSGAPEQQDVWIDEVRDIRQDFKRYFGLDVTRIDGVAVMTDCDNGGGAATGYYRDIRFAPA